jgi:hypothetical protein
MAVAMSDGTSGGGRSMKMKTMAIAVAGTMLALSSPATATHPDPGSKAKKIVADLVMAYEPCTAPDTVTDEFDFPACATPVRSDPGCGFGPNGKGKLRITVLPRSFRVTFNLQGLDAGCEGSIMGVVLRWRATGDDCSGAPCTLTDAFNPGFAACTVTGGKCVLEPSGIPFSFLPVGARTGVELRGADIIRDGTMRPFTMGFVLP